MAYSVDTIAELVHETLSVWARMRGMPDYPAWSEAPDWMRASTLESIQHTLENPDAPPGAQPIKSFRRKNSWGSI